MKCRNWLLISGLVLAAEISQARTLVGYPSIATVSSNILLPPHYRHVDEAAFIGGFNYTTITDDEAIMGNATVEAERSVMRMSATGIANAFAPNIFVGLATSYISREVEITGRAGNSTASSSIESSEVYFFPSASMIFSGTFIIGGGVSIHLLDGSGDADATYFMPQLSFGHFGSRHELFFNFHPEMEYDYDGGGEGKSYMEFIMGLDYVFDGRLSGGPVLTFTDGEDDMSFSLRLHADYKLNYQTAIGGMFDYGSVSDDHTVYAMKVFVDYALNSDFSIVPGFGLVFDNPDEGDMIGPGYDVSLLATYQF